MNQLFLSRRNLLTLLSKLDRKSNGEETACTLIKHKNPLDKFTQTMNSISVTAVEDSEYYTERLHGEVHPLDTP